MIRFRNDTHALTVCAMFVALLVIFSQIAIPLPMGVPINLALLAVYLCALLLPLPYALMTIGVYLLLGLLGVPVFAGFRGGPAALFGKTGGYLLGYLLCALIVGLLNLKTKGFWQKSLALLAGLFVCYVFGTAWFMRLTNLGLMESLGYCVFPFLPGDVVKILLGAGLAGRLGAALQKV